MFFSSNLIFLSYLSKNYVPVTFIKLALLRVDDKEIHQVPSKIPENVKIKLSPST